MNVSLTELLYLPRDQFYVTLNGKLVDDWSTLKENDNFRTDLRVFGGKGGFGSLLRSFGSQFYKSTNQDMCRDLSGRRLKDVKEEERLKKYISKAAQRESEKQRKLDEKVKKLKQLDDRKHEFNDSDYMTEKERILEETDAALQEGLKAIEEQDEEDAATPVLPSDEAGTSGVSSKVLGKRKRDSDEAEGSSSTKSSNTEPKVKKPKGDMWLGIDGLNESDLESGESDSEEQNEGKESKEVTTTEIRVTQSKTETRV